MHMGHFHYGSRLAGVERPGIYVHVAGKAVLSNSITANAFGEILHDTLFSSLPLLLVWYIISGSF